MKVGIVVVTYNSEKDIIRLFESIIIQDFKNCVVYLVDNNSSDSTLKIAEKFLYRISINIIATNENNGYAKGNNIGIRKAIENGCDCVFILNPDMQLEKNSLNILINEMSRDKKTGVVGPVVLLGFRNDNLIQNFGVTVNFKSQMKKTPYVNQFLSDQLPEKLYVDYVLGGAMMIRTELLLITGLLEEDYFMYNDEIDFAYRVKKAGYKTLCMRDAIVRHFHNFSKINTTGNNLMYYYIMRNRYLYFRKYQLYFQIFRSLFFEFLDIPFKIRWSIRKMGGIKLLKFYYAGLFDGLSCKKGRAEKNFDN